MEGVLATEVVGSMFETLGSRPALRLLIRSISLLGERKREEREERRERSEGEERREREMREDLPSLLDRSLFLSIFFPFALLSIGLVLVSLFVFSGVEKTLKLKYLESYWKVLVNDPNNPHNTNNPNSPNKFAWSLACAAGPTRADC